jgi:UDP-N-acetylmuramate dehydrogenase
MPSLNSHAKDLSRFWKGKILWDIPMAQFSSLKVGGPAAAVIEVGDIDELKKLMLWLEGNNVDWRVVGRGSNILVPDNGFDGIIIILAGDFRSVETLSPTVTRPLPEKVFIRAGGGCPLSKLVSYCISQGLSGLEFGVGIPGSIGGAVVMNAGAWGSEIGSVIDSVFLMNSSGSITSLPKKELGFVYRKWSLPQGIILLSATFALKPGSRQKIKAACRKYQDMRRSNQPISEPSAGSFFKNPPGESAGRLIEKAGLKGFSIGDAKVSEKHANFIINTGKASAADILNLMRVIQLEVNKRFGIKLEPEVHIFEENRP